MMSIFKPILCLAVALFTLAASSATAQLNLFGGGDSQEPITVSASYKIKKGTEYGQLSVTATLGLGYHTYAQDHEGIEVPTQLTVTKADGLVYSGQFSPSSHPHEKLKDGKLSKTFEVEAVWTMPFKVESANSNLENLIIEVEHFGHACNSNGCTQPKRQTLAATFDGFDENLKIDPAAVVAPDVIKTKEPKQESPKEKATVVEIDEKFVELYDAESKIVYEKLDGSSGIGTFTTALLGAFFGGLLLNLMPCVFPVLGLKVLGFVEQAGNNPAKIRMHGIAFAAGLIVSMWVLAGTLVVLKESYEQEVTWGQQMGNPVFLGGIVILLYVLGLNLVGVFEMGLFLTNVGSRKEAKEGYSGSFFSGILTTLVATPCSGPFLGAAMGYTLAQPPATAMLLFTIFGFGIAIPYLVLAFIPALIRFLPRPGGWMETFKKLMGFTLFAAAAFFAQSFGSLTGADGLSWLLMAMCVIALAAFFYGKFSPVYIARNQRFVWGFFAPILIAGVGIWMYMDASAMKAPEVAEDSRWQLWAPGKVEQLLASKKPIWVDYTANW